MNDIILIDVRICALWRSLRSTNLREKINHFQSHREFVPEAIISKAKSCKFTGAVQRRCQINNFTSHYSPAHIISHDTPISSNKLIFCNEVGRKGVSIIGKIWQGLLGGNWWDWQWTVKACNILIKIWLNLIYR
jgi:hypothetical protein